MPNTYTLIASNTLSSPASTITFSSIPQTYTDLIVRASTRTTSTTIFENYTEIRPNGSTTNRSMTYLNANGSTGESIRPFTNWYAIYGFGGSGGGDSAGNTANTFDNYELYIPNYTGSNNKVMSGFGVAEQNSATSYMSATAGLWRNTAAITSIDIFMTAGSGGTFATNSSFYLYGIKNS